MKIIIDRFEGEFAVVELENGNMVDIPKCILPNEAKEGSVLSITLEIDETEERANRIEDKFKSLFDND